jgi:hypothetical protein
VFSRLGSSSDGKAGQACVDTILTHGTRGCTAGIADLAVIAIFYRLAAGFAPGLAGMGIDTAITVTLIRQNF